MSKGITLSFDFINNYGRFAKPEHLRLYLYLLGKYCETGVCLTKEEISEELDISAAKAENALEFWIRNNKMERLSDGRYGFILTGGADPARPAEQEKQEGKKQKKKEVSAKSRFRPSYDMAEIDAAAAANRDIDGMIKQAERILNKMLTKTDLERLYSFHDWLGLDPAVIVMLLQYGAKHKKTGWRYLETVAMDWADQGIDTYEKAEAYISRLEEAESAEYRIRAALGIYDRALTQTEKKYIRQWTQAGQPLELVNAAYDRTVANTGKLSWAYMNRILTGWQEQGITNLKQLKEREEAFQKEHSFRPNVPNAPKSKFNNYTDPNRIDYDSISEQILQEMLDYGSNRERGGEK